LLYRGRRLQADDTPAMDIEIAFAGEQGLHRVGRADDRP
jgi:hypothetical protein